MSLKPTIDQVYQRLRISSDNGLDDSINDLIEQVFDEMLVFLDRKVYESQDELNQSEDATGLVIDQSLINGQILMIGSYLDQFGTQEGQRMRETARNIWQPYRRMGV